MADSDFGVLATGFSMKTADDLTSDIITDFQAQYGPSCPVVLDTSAMGFLRGVLTRGYSLLWQLGQAIYNGGHITADGASLANVLAIRGNGFLAETFSVANCICVGTNGIDLSVGRLVDAATTGSVWQSNADAVIATVPAWAANTSYELEELVTNGGNVYYCNQAGESASSGGPTGTGTAVTDNTAQWFYCGAGTAAVASLFTSQIVGPTVGASGDLNIIGTSVSGWNSVVNPLDAVLGQGAETDAQARLRSETELHSAGSSVLDAIGAKIEEVKGVLSVSMFENDSDVTDGEGRPPGSFEAIVLGGADQDVINAIGVSKAAGAQPWGTTTTGTYTDPKGQTHTIQFTRPAQVLAYITADILVDDTLYPSDGDDEVANNFLTYGEANLVAGYDLIPFQLARSIITSGVMDVTDIKIGTSPSPSSDAKISISIRQIAVLDSSRIVINSSAFVP